MLFADSSDVSTTSSQPASQSRRLLQTGTTQNIGLNLNLPPGMSISDAVALLTAASGNNGTGTLLTAAQQACVSFPICFLAATCCSVSLPAGCCRVCTHALHTCGLLLYITRCIVVSYHSVLLHRIMLISCYMILPCFVYRTSCLCIANCRRGQTDSLCCEDGLVSSRLHQQLP